MVRIVLDAGHGFHTNGKRSPSDEREWTFNNKVVLAAIAKLNTYQDVEILRVDDPTGQTDVPLATRTKKANDWKADVYVSCHHNALNSVWGNHGGVETFTHPTASKSSVDIAKAIHPRVVEAMELRDRGLKTATFQVLRETKMASVLLEGGFMDSTVDIVAMRDDNKLKAQGEAIAEGLAEYFKLKPKTITVAHSPPPQSPATSPSQLKENLNLKFSSPSLQAEVEMRLASKASREIIVNAAVKAGAHPSWLDKLANGTITNGDILGLSLKYTVDTNK